MALYEPITKQMKIDAAHELENQKVELKTTKQTEDEGARYRRARISSRRSCSGSRFKTRWRCCGWTTCT